LGQLKPEVHHLSINTSTGLVAWGSSSTSSFLLSRISRKTVTSNIQNGGIGFSVYKVEINVQCFVIMKFRKMYESVILRCLVFNHNQATIISQLFVQNSLDHFLRFPALLVLKQGLVESLVILAH
jgi:hypothetical protein